MKNLLFLFLALLLIVGCATLKEDRGLNPDYEVFIQKSLTELAESNLFNQSDSINLSMSNLYDFDLFVKEEFQLLSIENTLEGMDGKSWNGKEIFHNQKDFPYSKINIAFSDLIKNESTENSYSFLTTLNVSNEYECYKINIFWDPEINDFSVQKNMLVIAISGKLIPPEY